MFHDPSSGSAPAAGAWTGLELGTAIPKPDASAGGETCKMDPAVTRHSSSAERCWKSDKMWWSVFNWRLKYDENEWKWMKMNENEWKWMKMMEMT